jgi:hypothetical protein
MKVIEPIIAKPTMKLRIEQTLNTRHGPERDQQHHAVGQAAEERADDEDGHAELEHPLAAEQVAELPGQHRRHRLGQHVRGDHPAHVAGPAQVADDGGQRGGHDRLVERGQQQAEQDRDEHDVHLDPGQLERARCAA